MTRANRPLIVGVMHHLDTDPGLVADVLAGRGADLRIVRPRYGDDLPDAREIDAAVIFGGTMSVGCGETWMAGEIAWAGELMAAATPLLGICLGGQIIARRLGAAVGPHPLGRSERGYVRIRPTPAGAGMPDHVMQFHDEGFGLPDGATLMATGDLFPVQAFRHGSACALQFHPEATMEILERWTKRTDLDLASGCPQRSARNRADFALRQWRVERWLEGFLGEHLLGDRPTTHRLPASGCTPMRVQGTDRRSMAEMEI